LKEQQQQQQQQQQQKSLRPSTPEQPQPIALSATTDADDSTTAGDLETEK